MIEREHPASFRDPSGFLFTRSSRLLRQVNRSYRIPYDRLMFSGLYAELTEKRRLIPHRESDAPPLHPDIAYKVLEPEPIRFLSYPYEWCFGQLRDAALLTLKIMDAALRHGMVLKDASAYNIQFHRGRPILIDTLSFDLYAEGEPWVGYRQFCQHFLAPLAVMAGRDIRLGQLLRVHLDGIPLDLASRLLPLRSRADPGLLMHLHLHARLQRAAAAGSRNVSRNAVGKTALMGLVESLRRTVAGLKWNPAATDWAEYYENNNYTERSFAEKKRLVGEHLRALQPGMTWDLGGNTGVFSRIAAEAGGEAVCFDSDPGAVEQNYRSLRADRETRVLPLVLDLTSPSPPLGWSQAEREGFLERGPADAVLALALVHHLAIGNNLPLGRIADFLARCGDRLIVEFVPKEDSQVRRLLQHRTDIFPDYTREGFEAAFRERFRIQNAAPIAESARILYLMEKTAG
jgi:hypothetical protein